MIHLDTHAVLWIAARDRAQFTQTGLAVLEGESAVISAMVELELRYLGERGRLAQPPEAIIDQLLEQAPVTVSDRSLTDIVSAAHALSWTRDPFDRLIVANAIADGARLLTADRNILANFKDAVW